MPYPSGWGTAEMSDSFEGYAQLLSKAAPELEDQLVREMCEGSLYDFLKEAWPSFDPAPFVGGWHLEAIAEHLQAVSNGQIKKLLINVRPRSGKTGLVAVAWPTWTWALPPDPRYPLRGPVVRFLCGSYGANKAQEDGVTARRLIGSNWYQKLWGDRVVISKSRDNQEHYDTEAGGSRINTGIPESLGKGGVIRVLDDPMKTDEVESEKVREAVIRAYKEIWSTRSNDPNKGAEVMIMQRQAESDLSGYWLETGGPETVHLCIPAWHEEDRRCSTYVNGHLFWEDPRETEGESFWPERYTPSHRAIDEALGPYAFCTPAESPVLMADLSLKPISIVCVGDKVVGFTSPVYLPEKGYQKRNELVETEILAISRSRREVVRMTLDSGEVIRCTADHKWFTARRKTKGEPNRKEYNAARVGTPLMRVSPPRIDSLTSEMEMRAAGWLAGFFDGEGTVSIGLHVIKPYKWRDRLIAGGYRSTFITGEERVVSIEPDGEEEVFGLTTDTGNYVVWGLASSNSGQIQQRPAPRGGGIIRREWWQPWPPDDAVERWTNSIGQVSYPPWEIVIAYLDTAFTKKETNDWCAMSRLGVFGDSAGRPRAMLCGAWRERLNFRELVQKVIDTCRAGRVDILVIENKAGGIWVREELMKEMRSGEWVVVLDTPTVDKIARAHAVVPLFVDGVVHAPFMHEHGVWRSWAEMAIAEIESFPTGKHDDIVDSVVGGLGYLRRNDLIKLSVEHEEDSREKPFQGNNRGIAKLYEVD